MVVVAVISRRGTPLMPPNQLATAPSTRASTPSRLARLVALRAVSAAARAFCSAWAAASPARFAGPWPAGPLALLGWSPDDELIDEPEVDALAAVLARDGVTLRVFKDLEGRHNALYEDGRHFARLICEALKQLA